MANTEDAGGATGPTREASAGFVAEAGSDSEMSDDSCSWDINESLVYDVFQPSRGPNGHRLPARRP
jgi:hypothetical protein